jgi:hypothetical protein
MADYTQLHHDNGYGFCSGILSVIICKHRLAELGGEGVSKFTFQYTQSAPKVLGNDFQFSKIDFKTDLRRSI